jgi:hypothetical protein
MRPKEIQMKRNKKRTFKSKEVTLMHCTPGNYDHEDGEEGTIITVATPDLEIMPMIINLNDTRKLIPLLLSSLFTANDKFAEEIVQHFPINDKGHPYWPPSHNST